MADEETSDSDAAITVPATPVTKKKRLAPSKVKTAKPKKPIQSDEGMIQKLHRRSKLSIQWWSSN